MCVREREGKKNIAFRAVFIHHEWMKSPHFLFLSLFSFFISNLRQFSTNAQRNENLFLNFSIISEIIIIFAYLCLYVGGEDLRKWWDITVFWKFDTIFCRKIEFLELNEFEEKFERWMKIN